MFSAPDTYSAQFSRNVFLKFVNFEKIMTIFFKIWMSFVFRY